MDRMLRVSDALGRFVAFVGRLGGWVLIPLTLIIMFDVITRNIYWAQQLILESWLHDYISSTKLQEWQWHLHGVLLLLAFGLTYTADRHVRIDSWREGRSPRTQALIEILGIVFCLFPYASLMLYQTIGYATMSYVSNEVSSAMTGLSHRWIIKSFMVAAYALLLLAGVAMLLRAIVLYLRPPDGRPSFRIIWTDE